MKRKIRVLILTHMFPTKINPVAGIFLLNQLKELKKFCDVKVVSPHAYVPNIKLFNPYHKFSRVQYFEKIGGIPVYHPRYFMIPRFLLGQRLLHYYLFIESIFSKLASVNTISKLIVDWNPDIIHLHGVISESQIGTKIKKEYGKPIIVTSYGEDVTKYSKKFPSNCLAKISFTISDAIICQSKFLENEIRGLGINNKKFYIIPMGSDTGNFKPRGKQKTRKILNLPTNRTIILFVGHLIPRKGPEYLIKAIRAIPEKYEILCCLIGKGPLENKLKNMVSELNIQKKILFVGQKSNKVVADYMNACDLFVLPSLNEGLPVVLCEAIACSRPVVATNVAGNPEIINRDVGYLVKPKDSNDLAKKIILSLEKRWDNKNFVKTAKEFSVETSAKKIVGLYRQLLK